MFWKPNGTTMDYYFAQKAIMTQKRLKPKPTARPFLFFFLATWLFFSFPFEEIYF
jgi:hypothetical protein